MKRLKTIGLFFAAGLVLVFILFVYNQTLQFVRNIGVSHPQAGQWVLFGLLFLYALLFLLPLLSFIRYRRTPELPAEENGAAYEAYLKQVAQNLNENRVLKAAGEPAIESEEDILRGYATLNLEANAIIKKEATSIFLTTAISQNGSLDALFMVSSLTKMIWRLMHLYENRPGWARIVQLYGNIAGTVLLARSIEDMDLIEDQIEPLLASLLGGSVLNLVPGAQTVTNLVVSSVTEGAVNTLLALRVGAITRQYLTALTRAEKSVIRRRASLEAAGLLGGILKDNTVGIVKAFGRAAKSATKATLGL
ncbi:MAG: DUF697 domain-containing protein [Tissierellia bacterium]|jgi:hypothetical protein|nr:DUF697 domain-containing protein [Tissierellia bacterium]